MKGTTRLLIFVFFILTHNTTFSQHKPIEVEYKVNKDKSVDIIYKKSVPGHYTVKLEFTSLTNTQSQREIYKVVSASQGNIVSLKPYNPTQSVQFRYTYRYVLGNSKPKVDNSITYRLPFKENKIIHINEASNLEETYFGSEKPPNWKSFVVHTKTPDTVYCMRKGIVVKIENEYKNDNTVKKVFSSERNKIIIEHQDGSYALYKGFDGNKIFVKLGQEVFPDTQLGVLEKFNSTYNLHFNIYNYLSNLLENNKDETYKNRVYTVKFINPFFATQNGKELLRENNEYKVVINDEILFHEFSKREVKRYKKKSTNP